MNFKIKQIILWPKNSENTIRTIPFSLNEINVISGESHTGKSALVHIIDYCLASQKCTIPVGIIRDKVSWFGVLFETDNTDLLLARLEPGQQMSTNQMHMLEGKNIEIPKIIEANATTEDVKNRLNQLSGLSSERLDQENLANGFTSAASFRDTAAFQFQAQHIVANPYTLFFKADTNEHQQKLRSVMPLLLGITSNQELQIKKQIHDLEILYRKKSEEKKLREEAFKTWQENIVTLYLQTLEMGINKAPTTDTSNWVVQDYIKRLKEIVSDFQLFPLNSFSEGSTIQFSKMLQELLNKETTLYNDLTLKRIHLQKMERISTSGGNYRETLSSVDIRLTPIHWFQNQLSTDSCPFCDSKSTMVANQINGLIEEAERLKSTSTAVSSAKINLDKEINEIKTEIRKVESELNTNRKLLQELYKKSNIDQHKRKHYLDAYKLIGRIESIVESISATTRNTDLYDELETLRGDLAKLRHQLNAANEKQKTLTVLNKISELIGGYVQFLDIDRPDDKVILKIEDLNIKIKSSTTGREDWLWEVGSGANWMGYHLSTLFGLHEYFLSLSENFVPSFIFIDQPSQVYFPEKTVFTGNSNDIKQKDIEQTRKIFLSARECLKNTHAKLQVIFVEHAPKSTWEGIDCIHLIDEWRQEKALIPNEWI